MRLTATVATVLSLCAVSVAQADTITFEEFTADRFATLTADALAIEDFENLTSGADYELGVVKTAGDGTHYGQIANGVQTAVGTFTTSGGTGSGGTCRALGDRRCDNIAIQYDVNTFGQDNITPVGGSWSLNTNDTLGFSWTARLPGGGAFDSLVVALRDAVDAGADMTVTAGSATRVFSDFENGNVALFQVLFDDPVTSADVTFTNSRPNDGYNIDGAAILDTTPVPLPAPALLLLGGLGALVAAKRFRRA